jgi:hypothetical protein
MPYTQVSNLDYQQIKTALKEYLRSQTDFTDFDFEGSTWSTLLDVLAYNTYYTAFNTNMVVNELFLDSATLRDNVVALAKQLGYTPKSRTAPSATVDFSVNFPGSYPDNISLRKGSGFVTTFDNDLYSYVVTEDYKVPVTNGEAVFNNVEIHEGSFLTNSYTVNTSLKSQRFVLDNPSIDSTTISVKVYQSAGASSYQTYDRADNILNVTPTDKVFFLEEIEDEKYELFFGDGVIGRKLENGEFVEISYLITNGPDTNGARTFTFSGVLEDSNGISSYPVEISSVETKSIAAGGEDIESVSKIKFNAPKYFGTQDRAVTAKDYAAIVRNIYPAVADIITFGGEEADPPEYGKVKIAIKPSDASYLSNVTKTNIKETLRNYMVGSVIPEIIDPSLLFVELTSKINFSRAETTQTAEDIKSKVISGLESYIDSSNTEKFNGKFRYSKFVGVIDDADRSITSNNTTVMMRKDFYPVINSTYYYEVCYQNPFYIECDEPVMQSSGFVVSEFPKFTSYVEDRDGRIVLYRIDPSTGNKVVLNDAIGKIDYEKGEIMMSNLTIIKGSYFDNRIELRVKPRNNDIIASREVYLDVDLQNSKITAYPE